MKRPSKLSKTFVERVATPGRYGDGRGGHGLSLVVKCRVNGTWSKTWSQRIRVAGRLTNLGLGSYPVVSLDMAREQAIENKRLSALGEDVRPAPVPTVRDFLQHEFDARVARRRGRNSVTDAHRLMRYCSSILDTPVSSLTSADVFKIVEPMWATRTQTARDVRSFISAGMRRAITLGHRTTDPAPPDITRVLGPGRPALHHRSLPHRELGVALALIRDADAWWSTRYALLFLALTAVRSADVTEATWDRLQIESDLPIMHIPRTKNGAAHDVPLPTQAVEIVLLAKELGSGRERVFPRPVADTAISASTFKGLLDALGVDSAPHGFRSSFRNWAGARRGEISNPAAEAALEHKAPGIVGVYMTDDFFEERVLLMQQWADYLAETMGPVISERDRPPG